MWKNAHTRQRRIKKPKRKTLDHSMFIIDAAANFERLYEPETRLRIQRQPGFPDRLPAADRNGSRVPLFAPRGGDEQQKHRIELQTAEEHGKSEQHLAERREACIVGHRSDELHTGADVVKAARRGGKCCDEIQPFQREQDQKQHKEQRVHEQKRGNGAAGVLVERLARRCGRI